MFTKSELAIIIQVMSNLNFKVGQTNELNLAESIVAKAKAELQNSEHENSDK
jgi:hypothetical protein